MKNVQRGATGLIIMTEEYEQALANAEMDSRMDNTPAALWQALLDTAAEIDAANVALKD